MAENSKIEWTDATWNPIVGCSLASPGCRNCYAMPFARRHDLNAQKSGGAFAPQYIGTTQVVNSKPVWTGKVARASADVLTAPLRWRKPKRVFVNSMGDLFHESIRDAWIDEVFAVMALAPQHTFQVLTKRAARMREYLTAYTERPYYTGHACGRIAGVIERLRTDNRPVGPLPDGAPGSRWWPLKNVWLGISAERQKEADTRIPDLLATPAAIRFVSCEPLLGPIDLARIVVSDGMHRDALQGYRSVRYAPGCYEHAPHCPDTHLDWVIVGGESGPNARPMHPDWARSIRDQCRAAGVAYFFKQWGEWRPSGGWVDGRLEPASHGVSLKGNVAPAPDLMIGKTSGPEWDGYMMIRRVGKKAAGRLLDGREHNEFPIASSVMGVSRAPAIAGAGAAS